MMVAQNNLILLYYYHMWWHVNSCLHSFSVTPQGGGGNVNFPLSWPDSLSNLPPLWLLPQSVCISLAQTQPGQASPAPLGLTVPLPYMYTWSRYVNFDMWVSISPIFTMGFIRPWLVFRANLEVKRKTPLAVCKPTLRVPLLGTAYLQGSCLFC